jgi:hypothetical protein
MFDLDTDLLTSNSNEIPQSVSMLYGNTTNALMRELKRIRELRSLLFKKMKTLCYDTLCHIQFLASVRLLPLSAWIDSSFLEKDPGFELELYPLSEITKSRWEPTYRKFLQTENRRSYDFQFSFQQKLALFTRFIRVNDPVSKRGHLFLFHQQIAESRLELALAGYQNSIEPNVLELRYRYELWLMLSFQEDDCASLYWFNAQREYEPDYDPGGIQVDRVYDDSSGEESSPPPLPERRR